METTDQTEAGLRGVMTKRRGRPPAAPVVEEQPVSPHQSLALRIWEGQSPDVAVIDRVARIANALKGHGMPIDVELPHPDAKRYLDAHR